MTNTEEKALRAATAVLKSARLTAKASKAKLRALKSEAKIQKRHYKWARQQVRLAKEALAQWRSAVKAADSPSDESEIEHDAARDAEPRAKRAKRKDAELAIERHTLESVGTERALD
jgi:hypothetical protein